MNVGLSSYSLTCELTHGEFGPSGCRWPLVVVDCRCQVPGASIYPGSLPRIRLSLVNVGNQRQAPLRSLFGSRASGVIARICPSTRDFALPCGRRVLSFRVKERCESGRIGLTAKKSESPVPDRQSSPMVAV